MSHLVLCFCCHVNQCLPGLWPLQIRSEWKPHWEALPALIWPWTSPLAVGLFLFSAWEFMGKAHLTEVPHPPEPSFLPAAYSLCAFVLKRHFCCDLALRHPFDNLSISRSRHCVDQVPCQEEWQLRNLLEAPGVHVDASELRPSLLNPPLG